MSVIGTPLYYPIRYIKQQQDKTIIPKIPPKQLQSTHNTTTNLELTTKKINKGININDSWVSPINIQLLGSPGQLTNIELTKTPDSRFVIPLSLRLTVDDRAVVVDGVHVKQWNIASLQMLAHHHTIEEADEDRMSAQEETAEEDEKKRKTVKIRSLVGLWPVGVKFLEMCLCILSIAMIVEPVRQSTVGTRYTYALLLIFTTYSGFMVTIAILLLGRLFSDRIPYKTSALLSIIGSFLNLASGCLILVDRNEFSRKYIFYPNMYFLDMMCWSGVFAIINMFVYAIDAVFTIRFQADL